MNYHQSAASVLMKLIFPNFCLSCEDKSASRYLSSGILCKPCIGKLEPTEKENRINEIHFPEYIDEAYSCWWFNDTVQEVIHQLKYADRARIGSEMGKYAAKEFQKKTFQNVDLITAIPLHQKKERERGYNQAGWIAKGFARQIGRPHDLTIIKRKSYTISQTTLDREERLQNMENAFVTSRPLKGMKIGIIDDVLTTGATMSACSKALKQGGADYVMAITLATPKIKK